MTLFRAVFVILSFSLGMTGGLLAQRGSLRSQLEQAGGPSEFHIRIELMRRILDEEPNDQQIKGRLLDHWFLVKDYDMAESHLADWPNAPEDLRALSLARIAWDRDDERENAVRFLTDFLGQTPGHYWVSVRLADYLRQMEEWERLRTFLEDNPATKTDATLGILLADARRDTRAYAEALDAFTAAHELAPRTAAAPRYDRLKKVLPRLEEATAAIADDPGNFAARCRRAHYAHYVDSAKPLVAEDAVAALEIDEFASLPRVHLALASDLKEQEAREKYQANKEVSLPGDRDLETWIGLDERVAASLGEGQDGAEEVAARTARSTFLNNREQPLLALRDAERALQVAGEPVAQALAEVVKAKAALGWRESAEEALHDLERAEDAGPEMLSAARSALAAAYIRAYQFPQALNQLDEALALEESPKVYRDRALLHKRLGRHAEAEADSVRADELEKSQEPSP